MGYRERPGVLPATVVWQRTVDSVPVTSAILPDGCLDLLWDGSRLVVAGPDSAARRHTSEPGARYVAIRFAGGTGPAVLGIPAQRLRDQTPDLDAVLAPRELQGLLERVAADPAAALEQWVLRRAADRPPDPIGLATLRLLRAGAPVAVTAERLGLSSRQLHRRCLDVFGYGPQRLARILRLRRALDRARTGAPLAQVAAECGYADQPHLAREVQALTGTTPSRLLAELARR